MARRKREPMSEGKKNIIAELIEEYDIRTAKDIEDALRDLMGGTIQEMLEEIYGFEVSDGMVSDITDRLLPQIEDWQNRPLDEVYPIVFIDAVHFSVRDNGQIRKLAAYVILAVSLRRNWGSGDHVPRQAELSRHSQSASIPLRSISAD